MKLAGQILVLLCVTGTFILGVAFIKGTYSAREEQAMAHVHGLKEDIAAMEDRISLMTASNPQVGIISLKFFSTGSPPSCRNDQFDKIKS